MNDVRIKISPGWWQRRMATADWQHFYDGTSDVEAARAAAGSVAVRASARQVVIAATCLPSYRTAHAAFALSSPIDCISLTLVTGGRLQTGDGTGGAVVGEGDTHLADMALPREWRSVGDKALDEVTLFVPRHRFLGSAGSGTIAPCVVTGDAPAGRAIGASLRALADPHQGVDAGVHDAIAAAVVGVAVAAMRSTPGRSAPPPISDELKVDTIRRFIERHIMSDALTPDLIAGDFGLSRAVLYRMFEPLGGVTTYIRHRRMARAMHDLGSVQASNLRIGAIAHRYGYKNAAAFSRAFRETYGIAPRDIGNRPAVVVGGDRLIDFLAPLCGRAPA